MIQGWFLCVNVLCPITKNRRQSKSFLRMPTKIRMVHPRFTVFFRIRLTVTGALLLLVLGATVAAAKGPIRLFFEKSLSSASGQSREHRVRKGEWLYKILKARGLSGTDISTLLPLLKRLNPHIPDLDRLLPGQRLILPVFDPGSTAVPVSEQPAALKPSSASSGIQADSQSTSTLEYEIRPGDTLVEILQRVADMSTAEIFSRGLRQVQALNPELTDVDRLHPGQTIRIPGRFASSPAADAETRKEGPPLSPEQRKRFSMAMLKRAGFSFTPGRSVLFPAPHGGWIPIDLTETPVCKTPWGTDIQLEPKRDRTRPRDPFSSLVRVPVEDWNPKTVIQNLATRFPDHVSRPASGILTRRRGPVRTTVAGQNVFAVKTDTRTGTYCFVPIRPGDAGTSSLLKSYLAKQDVQVIDVTLDRSGTVSLSGPPSLSPNSLYMPSIQAARIGTELAEALGPSPLRDTLRRAARSRVYQLHALADAGLLRSLDLELSWNHSGISVSLSLPARVLTNGQTRVALLDQSIADSYLMSLVALKGYLCFELTGT
jgi:hypothetical protein